MPPPERGRARSPALSDDEEAPEDKEARAARVADAIWVSGVHVLPRVFVASHFQEKSREHSRKEAGAAVPACD